MNLQDIKELLTQVRNKKIDINDAVTELKHLPFRELGHTKIDTHRSLRNGYPEVIYGAGKTEQQICDIVTSMLPHGNNILITRVARDLIEPIKKIDTRAVYHEMARIISITQKPLQKTKSSIAIITAGTSDIPVAEEAAVTAEFLGNKIVKIFDVGVAGLHRLIDRLDIIEKAQVVIVVAGMEGALASVMGGLVDKPIIAVPTSIGYGANFGGLSALLGMLTSCACGISVVNIDNGFGAAFTASRINKI